MVVKTRRFSAVLMITLGAYLCAIVIAVTRPGAVLSSDKRIVIRCAHWQIETGPREAIDAMIERYELINPRVKVEQVAVPESIYKQWLRTQLIGGDAPDIIEFGHLFDADDIPPRFFEPISDHMELPNPYNHGTAFEKMRWRDTFLDGLNTPDTYIENLSNYYAVTLSMVSQRLFYNPDLLQDITGSPQIPTTFSGMQKLARQVAQHNQQSSQRISLYAGSQFHGILLMEQILSRAGIGLTMNNDRLREQGPQPRVFAVEFLRGSWSYHEPELLSALQNLREVTLNLRPGFQQLDRSAAIQEFLRRESLMIVTGTWDATSLIKLASFRIAVSEFPWPQKSDGPVGRYYWGPVSEGAGNTTIPLCLNRSSAHQKEAVDFLHFMTSIEGNNIFVKQSGWLPSIRGVNVPDEMKVYKPRFAGLPMRTGIMRGFGNETRELWHRHLHHLISINGSVEEFLDVFEDEFPAALRQDLHMQTRHMFRSLRHELPILTALAALDRLQAPVLQRDGVKKIRGSSQNITEARLYETLAALEYGPALGNTQSVAQTVGVDSTL